MKILKLNNTGDQRFNRIFELLDIRMDGVFKLGTQNELKEIKLLINQYSQHYKYVTSNLCLKYKEIENLHILQIHLRRADPPTSTKQEKVTLPAGGYTLKKGDIFVVNILLYDSDEDLVVCGSTGISGQPETKDGAVVVAI